MYRCDVLMKRIMLFAFLAIVIVMSGCILSNKVLLFENRTNAVLKLSCTPISEKEVSCQVQSKIPFDLFNESYQDMQICEEMGVPEATGGCFLQNASYDTEYINELESKKVGDCWATWVHRFIGIKKGITEIKISGTCEYNKVYKIKII